MRALVCFASRGGRTAAIAHAVGGHLEGEGLEVRVAPVERVGLEELARVDLLVLGTWVDGLVVARVRPAAAMRDWLGRLPRLTGTPTALFCTYGVHPRRALDLMAEAVGTRGAKVVAGASFGRRHDVRAVTRFADRLLPAVCRPSAGAPVVPDRR